ncbi:MAG: KilA-N domain-containing protein, partial [Pseudanabaena sp.]
MNHIKHDYKGITINQQSQDGYINLNQMAEASGKLIHNWLQNKSTKELFAEFYRQQSTTWNSDSTTWNSMQSNSDTVHLVPALITYEGNNGGTWAHPDIALQFAQWCSAAFALQVSRWVRDWIATNKPPAV